MFDTSQDLHEIINNIPQMIWKIQWNGQDYITLFTNKSWDDYTGNMNIMSVYDKNLVHPDDLDIYTENLIKSKTFVIKTRLKRRDGIYRWFLTRAVMNTEGIYFGTCTDIEKISSKYMLITEKTRIDLAEHVADEKNCAEEKATILAKKNENERITAEKTRIDLAEHAENLANIVIEKELERDTRDKTRIIEIDIERDTAKKIRLALYNKSKKLETEQVTLASERVIAENARIVLAEHAEILANAVIEKELERDTAEKIRLVLYEKAKTLACERVTAEKTRMTLAEGAKILASNVIEKEIERDMAEKIRLTLYDKAVTAEKTRMTLAEGAKILASDVIEKKIEWELAEKIRITLSEKAKLLASERDTAEQTRIDLARDAIEKEHERIDLARDAEILASDAIEKKHERDTAEKTRITLAESAKILANRVVQREQEKELAEETRLALLEHAKVLANVALTNEFEKELAEQVRVKLSEYAKVLATDVLKKDLERNLAEHTRIVLSKHAKVLAGEVLITNELLLQMQLDKVLVSESNTASMAEMSHEIRNPLHGVIGIIEMMSDIELRPELRDYVDSLKELSSMLLNVVNDVLDISKLDSRKLEIEYISYDPYNIINDLCIVYSSMIQSKGLHLIHQVNTDTNVVGDPHRIKQILNNLMSNAIKFTERGDITLSVEILGENIVYSVKDSGMGITSENLEKLFKPYSQLNTSTSRLYGGSGLGLSICRKLVELMGGTIGANSTKSVGSTFWVKIPLTQNTI
jgi:signal transduction histidine kinase